jgi:hypothetical protein
VQLARKRRLAEEAEGAEGIDFLGGGGLGPVASKSRYNIVHGMLQRLSVG